MLGVVVSEICSRYVHNKSITVGGGIVPPDFISGLNKQFFLHVLPFLPSLINIIYTFMLMCSKCTATAICTVYAKSIQKYNNSPSVQDGQNGPPLLLHYTVDFWTSLGVTKFYPCLRARSPILVLSLTGGPTAARQHLAAKILEKSIFHA